MPAELSVERLGEKSRMHPNADVLQGALDLLILKAVSIEPMHGWESRSAFSKSRAACSK
jgi:hypothetical protein